MSKLFGTDGVRGIANTELTCELAMNIAKAAATVIGEDMEINPTVLIGSDTRLSGDMFLAAISAGLVSVGANAINLGVVPTPAIAYLVIEKKADMGIMISASHNPFDYNGIKIFGSDGMKLSDEEEFMIEKIVLNNVKPYAVTWGKDIGHMRRSHGVDDYISYVAQTVQGTDLSKLKVLVDCSHGSASVTAKKLFDILSIQATIIHASPDGININKNSGSTHMEALIDLVKNGDYDAGIAYDGDADRCLMVDEKGTVVGGDQIMALLALDLKKQGLLKEDTLVATIMSNMGLFRFGKENDIVVKKTKVGDRHVLEHMVQEGFAIGGEQSGHLILLDYMTTGDGQLTSLHVLQAMVRCGKRLSQMTKVMTVYPQVMKNIRANNSMKAALAADVALGNIIRRGEEKLKDKGRILVRPSGTEPVIRVMIEGENQEEIETLLASLVEDMEERFVLLESQKHYN